MHITISDQKKKGHNATLCYDRDTQSCQVLQACCPEHAEKLMTMAKALGAKTIGMAIPRSSVDAFKAVGWQETDVVLMFKEAR